jgi:histidinol-phosphatase
LVKEHFATRNAEEMMSYRAEYGSLLGDIAREADIIAMKYFRADGMRVDRKSDGSAVTQADRAVEEMARAKVAASGLALDVLGEEMGGPQGKPPSSAKARLIIDPIDGTEEFSRGIQTFGTLLAIERDGEIVAGMASAPGLASRWWAYRGEGAYRNGKRIHVSNVARLSEAMVFTTGTGPSKDKLAQEKIRRLPDSARSGRALGGFWQHMLVAEGATEAALDWTSKPWDLAPLGIIVEEAGGRSSNVRGERTIYAGNFLSTNGKIHDEVLRLLQ